MKKLLLICGLLFTMLLSACSAAKIEHEEVDDDQKSMFVCCESTISWRVYYHRETKVMYVAYNGHGWTLLVNPDGTPMLYK